jgi:hypothetical protein
MFDDKVAVDGDVTHQERRVSGETKTTPMEMPLRLTTLHA